jgi:L-malate glycosyltransferase
MAIDQKINICHLVSGDLWAGAEVQMFTLLKALAKEPSLRLSAIILNPGKLADQLDGIGIEVAVLDERKEGFLQLRKKISLILREKNIDIVHSHRYKENILAGLIKRQCRIKRLIQTVHGASEPFKGIAKYKTRIYTSINRLITRHRFDKIIAVSDDLRSQLANIYPSTKLIAIHNAIDPQTIKPTKLAQIIRQEFGIETGVPLIGATGRMMPVKAYDLFLKMAQLILERRPNARFILVGDGPQLATMKDLAQKLGIANRVIFPGFRDDIIDVMNAFDIFVISSHHEGVPMALLEAMSLKKAIVSTAVGGINEVIENGISGLLVEPNSPDALAKACLRILDDNNLKQQLESAAAKRVEDGFAISALRERMIALYREIVL